jgi:hypothetical protein
MAIAHCLGHSDDLKLNRTAKAAASMTHGVLLFIPVGAATQRLCSSDWLLKGLGARNLPMALPAVTQVLLDPRLQNCRSKKKVSPP